MRTTLDIDEDILQAVHNIAKQSGLSIGKVLSDLARQSLPSQTMTTVRNGIPLFPRQPNATVVTLDLVNRLRDETL